MKNDFPMTIETVTPTLAAKYLTRMIQNRKLKQDVVLKYAVIMDNDEWVLNGDTLRFNDDGFMIDGQHRCHACILSGKPFRVYVVRGLQDKRAFATIDAGAIRTSGDIFSIAGIKDANNAAAAATRIYLYKKGLITMTGIAGTRTQQVRNMVKGTDFSDAILPKVISRKELLDYAQPFLEGIHNGLVASAAVKISRLIPVSMGAALHVLFSEKGKDDANNFIHDFGSGAGLQENDPVHVLRQKLIGGYGGHSRLSLNAKMALIIIAWNKRRAGEKSKILKLHDDTQFPKIK